MSSRSSRRTSTAVVVTMGAPLEDPTSTRGRGSRLHRPLPSVTGYGIRAVIERPPNETWSTPQLGLCPSRGAEGGRSLRPLGRVDAWKLDTLEGPPTNTMGGYVR